MIQSIQVIISIILYQIHNDDCLTQVILCKNVKLLHILGQNHFYIQSRMAVVIKSELHGYHLQMFWSELKQSQRLAGFDANGCVIQT